MVYGGGAAGHKGGGVFLEDYVLFQGDPAAPTCDPWAVLAALAVRTAVAHAAILGRLGCYQPKLPGSPLNGPTTRDVTQPP